MAVVGFVTGYLASTYGLKPYPFYLGIAFAILGLVISWVIIVKDTRKFTVLEIKNDLALKENLVPRTYAVLWIHFCSPFELTVQEDIRYVACNHGKSQGQ